MNVAMNSFRSSTPNYAPIHDGESESFLSLSEKDVNECNQHVAQSRSWMRKFLPWALHLGLVMVYTTIMLKWTPQVIIREPFDAPADVPIEYETVRYFDSSKPLSPYFGASTPETDLAWDSLLPNGPGIVWIDEKTAKKLPEETERVRDYDRKINPDLPGYMGDIEVAHQLHCLNRIRKLFYNQSRDDFFDDSRPEMRVPHTMHCFEYLRQVIQCHGDVGIMSLGWDDTEAAYTAKFETNKQCRRFDLIQDWVKKHRVLTFLPKHLEGKVSWDNASSKAEPVKGSVEDS